VLGPRQGYGPDAASATRLRAALRRTRARMVDLDSWVSGGLGCPFATAPPRLRERGLALYPKRILRHANRKRRGGDSNCFEPANGDVDELPENPCSSTRSTHEQATSDEPETAPDGPPFPENK